MKLSVEASPALFKEMYSSINHATLAVHGLHSIKDSRVVVRAAMHISKAFRDQGLPS